MATARQALSWARRNKNFMTPITHKVKTMKNEDNTIFVELSQGTDFNYQPMYGVGIIIWNVETQEFQAFSEDKALDNLKKMFKSYEEAHEYFKMLVANEEPEKEIEA